jgi:hypothetical protein
MLIFKRSNWSNLNQERSYSREATGVTSSRTLILKRSYWSNLNQERSYSREVTGVTFIKNAHTQEKLLE